MYNSIKKQYKQTYRFYEKNLSNFFDVSVEGLGDGISNFFSGLENVIMELFLRMNTKRL